MYNLKKKLHSLTAVEDWHETIIENTNYLDSIFDDVLSDNNIFAYIYVSIRENPRSESQEEEPTYTYVNVGATTAQIADYFNTRYSCNYFLYNFKNESDYNKLKTRITSIYLANFYKYKKLIEIMGYRYNPLYNVDGTELYTNMESIGDTASSRSPKGKTRSTSGTLSNNAIGESTTTNYINPFDQNGSNVAYVDNKSTQSAVTTETEFIEYSEDTAIDNKPAQAFEIDQEGHITKKGLYSMAAKDSAFGVAIEGAERYYAEKRIRQGNIGITKTTELIQSQRDIVRFNILDEFFKDLEREIIVGIY